MGRLTAARCAMFTAPFQSALQVTHRNDTERRLGCDD